MTDTKDYLISGLKEINFSGKSGQNNRRFFIKECLIGGQQSVHTPFDLCNEMLGKLKETCEKDGKKLEDQRILVLGNVEFLEVLIFDYDVSPENLYFIGDSFSEVCFVNNAYRLPLVAENSFIDGARLVYNQTGKPEGLESIDMKFDCVIGNPPYQAAKAKTAETNCGMRAGAATLWGDFVHKSLDIVKDNGFVCLIHPAGWRRPNSTSKDLGNKIKSNKVLYLELHSLQDGLKTFGVNTNYDWYVLQNCPNDGETTVKDYSGKVQSVDLKNMKIIPNEQFDKVLSVIAKDGEDTCEILHSYSSYFTRKEYMSREKTSEFCYPCIYSLPQKGMQLFYSSTNKKGHFGIPKVIFSNGAASQVIVDEKGEYGLTQFACAIIDDIKNFDNIKKALESKKFIDLCSCFRFTFDRYDDDYFKLFRKDFWKEFI